MNTPLRNPTDADLDVFDPRSSRVPFEAIVTLRAEGRGPPFEIRLRRALKALLRAYGLRCTAVAAAPAPPSRPTRDSRVDRPNARATSCPRAKGRP